MGRLLRTSPVTNLAGSTLLLRAFGMTPGSGTRWRLAVMSPPPSVRVAPHLWPGYWWSLQGRQTLISRLLVFQVAAGSHSPLLVLLLTERLVIWLSRLFTWVMAPLRPLPKPPASTT